MSYYADRNMYALGCCYRHTGDKLTLTHSKTLWQEASSHSSNYFVQNEKHGIVMAIFGVCHIK